MKKFLLSAMIAGGLTASCQIEPELLEDEDAVPVELEYTANYKFKKTDILLLQENSGTVAYDGFLLHRRLYGNRYTGEAIGQASGVWDFGYKLYYSGLDFKLAIAGAEFSNEDDVTNNAGGLVQFSPEIGYHIGPKTPDLINVARTRIPVNAAGRPIPNDQNFLRPLSALKGMIEKDDLEDNPAKGFLRKGAFLNVIYIGVMDEVNETVTTEEITRLLNTKVGKGMWRVSVITSPEKGCMFMRSDLTQVHTHQMVSQLPTEEEWMAYERKNLMLKLQEATGGTFGSICTDDFRGVFSRMIKEGSDNAFFPVKLDKAANPISIRIVVDNSAVEGWKYDQAKQILYVPTTVESGSTFKLAYRTTNKPGKEMYYWRKNMEEVENIAGRELTPAEKDFNARIKPILESNGCAGCHSNMQPRLTNIQELRNVASKIITVINLPLNDPKRMPKDGNGFDSPANKTTFEDYVKTLLPPM